MKQNRRNGGFIMVDFIFILICYPVTRHVANP